MSNVHSASVEKGANSNIRKGAQDIAVMEMVDGGANGDKIAENYTQSYVRTLKS